MTSTVVVGCFLVMVLGGNSVMGIVKEKTVFAGDDVLLPCKCSEKMVSLVWQIGEEKVVSLYNISGPLHESYKDRTQLFLPNERNCSLLLKNVSLTDRETFTCYVFSPNNKMLENSKIMLKVQVATQTTPGFLTNSFTSVIMSDPKEPERFTGVSIGVPFTIVALLIVAGVILIRCHQQRPRTMVVVVDTQAAQPIMNSPV